MGIYSVFFGIFDRLVYFRNRKYFILLAIGSSTIKERYLFDRRSINPLPVFAKFYCLHVLLCGKVIILLILLYRAAHQQLLSKTYYLIFIQRNEQCNYTQNFDEHVKITRFGSELLNTTRPGERRKVEVLIDPISFCYYVYNVLLFLKE